MLVNSRCVKLRAGDRRVAKKKDKNTVLSFFFEREKVEHKEDRR